MGTLKDQAAVKISVGHITLKMSLVIVTSYFSQTVI